MNPTCLVMTEWEQMSMTSDSANDMSECYNVFLLYNNILSISNTFGWSGKDVRIYIVYTISHNL